MQCLRFPLPLLFAAALNLPAQNPTAILVATVTDPTGSVVVNAAVEIRNSATNEVRKPVSGQKGEFLAPNFAPGVCEVSISKEGFHTLRQTARELQLDQEARILFSSKWVRSHRRCKSPRPCL